MDNSNDDTELHLETVGEVGFFLRLVPNPVNSEPKNAVLAFFLKSFLVVAAVLNYQRNRKELVVHQTAIERKEAHEHQQVLVTHKGVLLSAQMNVYSHQQHNQSVTNIPKHEPKKKRKRDHRKNRGIGFFVLRDSVKVGDFLERLEKLVVLKVGGRLGVSVGIKDFRFGEVRILEI